MSKCKVGEAEIESDGTIWIKKWEALMPDLHERAVKVFAEMKAEGVLHMTVLKDEADFLEGFLFDTHPDWEIEKWEKMVSVFKERAAGKGKTARDRIWREGFDSKFTLETRTPLN